MLELLQNYYFILKVIHIVSFTAWMAGIFYLPRLFVYHSSYSQNSPMLEIMERKLYKIIMIPAMYLTLLSGTLLMIICDCLKNGWMHLKIACVIFLVMFQSMLGRIRKQFVSGNCTHSSRFFRLINEIPTLILIIIVYLVIFKPF